MAYIISDNDNLLAPRITNTNIARHHADYDKYNSEWSDLFDFYKAGFDLDIKKVLTKFFREDDKEYDYRCNVTPYINFPRSIIEFLPKMVFEQDITWNLPAYADSNALPLMDIDINGTMLDKYVKEMIILSRCVGKMYTLVDISGIDGDRRPYVVTYLPTSVINWRKSRDGFDWIVFEETNTVQPQITDNPEEVKTYRYWSRNEIAVWEVRKNSYRLIHNVPNDIGEVPVVEFSPLVNLSGLNIVDSGFYDLVQVNRAWTTILSNMLLNMILQNGQLVLPTESVVEATKSGYGDANIDPSEIERTEAKKMKLNSAITEQGESKGTSRIIAPANTIPQHLDGMNAMMDLMYKIGGIAYMDDRGESGVTKSYRFKETKSNLAHLADQGEIYEKNIIYFMARMKDKTRTVNMDDIKIEFERDYDTETILDKINQIKAVGDTFLSWSETFLKAFLEERLNSMIKNVDNKARQKIAAEVGAMVYDKALMKSLSTSPPASGSNLTI
ncbi:MAG: hypothetical protein WC440_02160 [Candidatus Omnitrophota bacterium]